ncbi:Secreted repeat of unknown function [Pseudonocardia thermophila]|jgi:Uncharacterized protein conserved in bacteria|uniref:Lipoprotein with Yx(FWY)xxD motif n=1 Tax=Pseudonocardia thermophila TaxID=1848 RepID=A0A1M6TZ61_PSETH|nr:hypothetical protein [Pseudonocardia thermophila]SHK62201.1 Secreted repeat of unknown function [Pseudonocardia thermophila]
MSRHRHRAPHPRTGGIIGGIVGGAATALGLLLVTAACGSTLQTVPAREAPPISGAVPQRVTTGLATAVTALGSVVTVDGYTVYRFDQDSADPSRSTCTGECAKQWPPVLGDGLPRLTGVPAEQVGTVGRPDGTQQLTLNGWPLYRYAGDAAPGDVEGDGVGGVWHAVEVDGEPHPAHGP